MSIKAKLLAVTAIALALPAFAATSASAAGGLISIIVNDPSNPYWLTEGNVAAAEAQKLGYTATVGASKGDTNTESNLIDTAITNKAVAIILDPANASGSVGAVKKAIAANIPVVLVNAEINQEGLAKAQLVSNNAQGAALGAQQWVKSVGQKGNYVELLGAPSDNNAATRSNGYDTVLSQYDDLKKVGSQVANWDRTQGHDKMQNLLQAHPDIVGVISGNDEMALGAIAALKEAGKLSGIKVGGFDGSPGCGGGHQGGRAAIHGAAAGRDLRGQGRRRSRQLHQDRQDRSRHREAALRLHPHHQGQRRQDDGALHALEVRSGSIAVRPGPGGDGAVPRPGDAAESVSGDAPHPDRGLETPALGARRGDLAAAIVILP